MTPLAVLGRGVGECVLRRAQGRRVGALPVALELRAVVVGEQREAGVVQDAALGDEVGDLTQFLVRDPAGDERRADQRVLAGQQFTRAQHADDGAALAVHLRVVEGAEREQEVVRRVDEAVVEVEGLRAGDGSFVDVAAQGLDAVESLDDGGHAAPGVVAHVVADPGVLGLRLDLGHRLVGGTAAAAQLGEGIGGPWVGQIDKGLAALFLKGPAGVGYRVADLVRDPPRRQQLRRGAARDHRGESPDGGQGHQRHQEQRHDLPADGLPAKAHGLPRSTPAVRGTHVRQQTARAYY